MTTPPKHLSRDAKIFWSNIYANSTPYLSIPGYYYEDAELTANVTTQTALKRCPPLPRLPAIGDLVELGQFDGVDYADKYGTIFVEDGRRNGQRYKPLLMWSERARACLVVPSFRPTQCDLPPVPQGSAVLRRWTQGRRGGRCSVSMPPLPTAPLRHCYPCIAISYTSDKFGAPGEYEEYIHHIDSPGVRVWMTSGSPPALILIQGGRLRVEEHGISG